MAKKSLYDRQNYRSSVGFFKGIIYEYDMIQAGFSVIKDKELLSKEKIEELAGLSKYKRNVAIGMICRNDHEILDEIEAGIKASIKAFCINNEIERSDIISIKRDAVFTIKKADNLSITDSIGFRLDNKFSNYFLLGGIEFYYSSWKDKLITKGLGKTAILHEAYFLDLIRDIINKSNNIDKKQLFLYLDRKRKQYLNRELDTNYYREMNFESGFRLIHKLSKREMVINECPEDYFDDIDIGFNYVTFMIPLIKYLVAE